MATRAREAVHVKEKSISAPSTPIRSFLPPDSPSRDIPMAPERPAPNYQRPTISSRYNTCCRSPKSQQQQQQQQQHTEDPVTAAAARKRLTSVKSMEHPEERAPRTDPSPKPALSPPKIVPERSSKAPTSTKTLTKTKSLPARVLKRRETTNGSTSTTGASKLEQEEEVLSIDYGVQGHAAAPHGRSRSPKSKSEGKHRTTSEESDSGKPRAPRVKVTKKVSGNEGAPRKLRFQRGTEVKGEGKEAVGGRLKSKQSGKGVVVEGEGKAEQEKVALKRETATDNDVVIGQAATKLAMRNKVKALVGAFESGISLQEPESQPSQRQEVAAVKLGRARQPGQTEQEVVAKVGEESAERGQPDRVKPEKEVKVGEEGAERGQPGKRQPEEVVEEEEECGREGSKGGHAGQESQQKEPKGEEQRGEEESKDGRLGRESQQKETKGEEQHSGEEESKDGRESQHEETEEEDKGEDDSLAEEELTESTKEDEGEPFEPLDS